MTIKHAQVVYLMRRFGLTETQAAAVAHLVWGAV
jgi:hypothetical protein